MTENDAIIRQLEKDLEQYDRILLLGSGMEALPWDMVLARDRRIMIYSADTGALPAGIACRQLSAAEERSLLELYAMYEFSDRVCVLTGQSQYGTLANYVKTGVLTAAEMVEALLA